MAYWAATTNSRNDIDEPSYMAWNAAKSTVRGLMTPFLIFLFIKVNARALPLNNRRQKMNHFLVPVVMLGIFSALGESLIDQYIGPVEMMLRFVIIQSRPYPESSSSLVSGWSPGETQWYWNSAEMLFFSVSPELLQATNRWPQSLRILHGYENWQ